MVENEGLIGKPPSQLDGRRQLLRENQEIICKPEFLESRDPAQELGAEHEIIIRLVLHHMPHSNQLRVAGKRGELLAQPLRAQIDPANNAFNRGIFVGKLQQPERFLHGLPRLHGNRTLDANFAGFLHPIRRKPVAVQRRVLWYPRVLLLVVLPEVLVRIENHFL